jgi:prophage tail gpP-like protein
MGPEIVTVATGGNAWSAFESVDVTAGANEAARSFRLTIAAQLGAAATAWTFTAGTEVSISSNNDLLVTGYVDRYQPHLNEHSQAIIHVSGRAARVKTRSIAQRCIRPAILKIRRCCRSRRRSISSASVLRAISRSIRFRFTRSRRAKAFFAASRNSAGSKALSYLEGRDGSINITRLATGGNAPLIEGVNCKSLSADHNWAGRHSTVITRGQRPIGSGAQNLQIEQTAQDPAVTRYRPWLLVIDEDTDATRAMQRAKWRLAREAGYSLKANILVQGFHDDGGQLWTPGNTVWLDSQFLAVQQMMAIERVVYSQSRSAGSTTHLSLCDPQALGGQGGGGVGGDTKFGLGRGRAVNQAMTIAAVKK